MFVTLIVFLKDFFKVNFKRSQQMTTKSGKITQHGNFVKEQHYAYAISTEKSSDGSIFLFCLI